MNAGANALKGKHLRLRSMAYVAAAPVPFFWPMRSFIHHNPLHGLEHLPFEQAVERGSELFHARGFLPRRIYQRYLADGSLEREDLMQAVQALLASLDLSAKSDDVQLERWVLALLEREQGDLFEHGEAVDGAALFAHLHGRSVNADGDDVDLLKQGLRDRLLGSRPLYECLDSLYGESLLAQLNDAVVNVCLAFFDEGQAVWPMPGRESGLFAAWRQLADEPVQGLLDDIEQQEADGGVLSAEMVVGHLLTRWGVDESDWVAYLTRELAHLHGWAGFVRWRADTRHYYWSERFPGDLMDLLALRLSLAWQLMEPARRAGLPSRRSDVVALIDQHPYETDLRLALHGGQVLAVFAQRIDDAVARFAGKDERVLGLWREHEDEVRRRRRERLAGRLRQLAISGVGLDGLMALDVAQLQALLVGLKAFESREGMVWLKAMEALATRRLMGGVAARLGAHDDERERRPFAQAAFCIDTRSERIRRHLEGAGDYQTFGIAGFFGVPVSLVELGKGSEMHLCPVLLTPKNLVLEMSTDERVSPTLFTVLEKAVHKLKETVLSPFVTVEAMGWLFGFDMLGKTLAPPAYARWREHLHEHKPSSHLLIDKLGDTQSESIVRTAQRAIIAEALEQELGLASEAVTDDLVSCLREAALGRQALDAKRCEVIGGDAEDARRFVQRLRDSYRITAAMSRLQKEELGRIGFSLDEQVGYVSQALSSIGLVKGFSRFMLIIGHGSQSDNNPYESALDCGACGGNHGLASARVLAHMANRPEVRERLRAKGINIAPDCWFLPAMHNTTTDEVQLHDLELLPSTHLVYLDRLRAGLNVAARLCAQERMPSLQVVPQAMDPAKAARAAKRNSVDWSQVRPEWGLSRNAWFVIGRRELTEGLSLEGRAFLHSYDYHVDGNLRLLENILTGPLVVGQWINMEHYFSAVDNERFGSGSKVYHNVAGRFGVMTGNQGDLRTGLPSQTVLSEGLPYHQPIRLIVLIEAPFDHARIAVENVAAVNRLVRNEWLRMNIVDTPAQRLHWFENGAWSSAPLSEFYASAEALTTTGAA